MSRLEDITVGSTVKGILGNGAVTIVAVQWYGSNVIEITYKDSKGVPGTRLLYKDSEAEIEVVAKQRAWNFDADANQMKLVSEAYRISMAHLFDPYLAVHTSSVEPLPHQISAVYQDMLPKVPLRFILADDPGAGKTIMTGLYIKELIARGDLKRCLIVTPGNLVEQWQDELYTKFHLKFEILTNDRMESSVSGNIFTEVDRCICRMDKLARNDQLKAKLRMSEWDLIVVDEAHKMAATVWGGEVKYTKRFLLGKLLSDITRNFLLLTATPHNGKEKDFQLFLSLIDPDRFGVMHKKSESDVDLSDVMRRLVKEDLLKFDGTPLFPERRTYTVNYDLSPAELQLYQAVTEYVREEFNRAEKLNKERKTTVGFALTVLQRRLASSPEAIYQSLRRRRERLEHRLEEANIDIFQDCRNLDWDDEMDEDDLPSDEQERMEDQFVDQASAAATISEIKAEIDTLKHLEKMANNVRVSGIDRKWEELSRLLQDNAFMYGENGQREKLIIFTEHKDTLNYLASKIRSLLGREEAVVTIHGGMPRNDRRKVERLFKQDVDVRILIATDAAGEGINLQRAHLMINYDLPWNPNRLEQRFGRIHRIGQTEVCHCWNLVASETREGYVFQRLLDKLNEEREALGGKVFDILGKMTFDNKPLKDLLVEAIRYGNDPEVRARMNKVVDRSMNPETFKKLLEDQALTNDVMDISTVNTIKEDMERMEAHKLQPHFIKSFFMEAFKDLGGQINKREEGRYQIRSVPYALRNYNVQSGLEDHVLRKYERVCFDKQYCVVLGKPQADLLCPGHPLLEAVINLIKEKNVSTMKRGTIFVDDSDFSMEARLLFYIEDSVQDGIVLKNGERRTISKHLHFVELKEDGSAFRAGYAPYLDYRAPNENEKREVDKWIQKQNWLNNTVEDIAKKYAVQELIPWHISEIKKRKKKILDKTEKAVKDRLTAEIQFWDYKAGELTEKEAAGKGIKNSKLNSQKAKRRADDLAARLHDRLELIEQERRITPMPPVITGGALVIPKGLLHKLSGKTEKSSFGGEDKQSTEYAAMDAVIRIEKSLGYYPKDVSKEKVGYDIESFVPKNKRTLNNDNVLRFIEVKGRQKGADTVTVSLNEILTALNRPDDYILAIVMLDGEKMNTYYLKGPFRNAPDISVTSVNYNIQDLIENSDVVYQN